MMYDPDDYTECACTRCAAECLALDEESALCAACSYDGYAAEHSAAEALALEHCCECGALLGCVPLYAVGASLCRACAEQARREHEASHRSAYRAGLWGAIWPNPSDEDRAARAAALAAYEASCVGENCRECGEDIRIPKDAFPICAACTTLL